MVPSTAMLRTSIQNFRQPITLFGSIFGKSDLLAIFHIIKHDVKCGTCLHKFDCRETTLSNAANHFKIFLIELEICLYLYKHLHFLYIRNPLFPIANLNYTLKSCSI